jgi:DNA-binding transcriptional ArsR family regulator
MSADLLKTVVQNYTLFYSKLWSGIRMTGEHGGHIYYGKPLSVVKESQFGVDLVSANKRQLRYMLGWLISGTRGGVTRAQVIKAVHDTPQNANQLANALKMDYKTVRYHLEVLEKNRLVTSVGDRYGATYFLTQIMEDNYVLFEEILNKIWKK